MTACPTVNDLYQDYTKERNLLLSPDQFASFLAFFPSLLVVSSDGFIDKEEWLYVKKLAKGLGNSFSEEELSAEEIENLTLIYKSEFRYLLKNLPLWEKRFLNTLREYLLVNDYAKQFVVDTLFLFADASDGISDSEQKKIKYIKESLALDEEFNY
jgi:tellurite resistance protein